MADINPPIYKPKIYRLWELERIAASHFSELSIYIDGCRVNIELFIDKVFGVRVESFYKLRERHATYAFTIINENYIFIDDYLFDDDKQEKKLRFTVAEEFAHYLIHNDVYRDCMTAEDRINKDSEFDEITLEGMENNARALAGMFLMPKQIIEKKVEIVLQETGSESIDDIAREIYHDFDVNMRCARMRLKTLGYHRKGL